MPQPIDEVSKDESETVEDLEARRDAARHEWNQKLQKAVDAIGGGKEYSLWQDIKTGWWLVGKRRVQRSSDPVRDHSRMMYASISSQYSMRSAEDTILREIKLYEQDTPHAFALYDPYEPKFLRYGEAEDWLRETMSLGKGSFYFGSDGQVSSNNDEALEALEKLKQPPEPSAQEIAQSEKYAEEAMF